MKIKNLDEFIKNALSPDDCWHLIRAIFNLKKIDLYLYPDYSLPMESIETFKKCYYRLQEEYPLAYILNSCSFFKYDFYVDERCLIPRESTSQLVELASNLINTYKFTRVLDLGTGSGCIAISLALEYPQCHIYASDICADALTVANLNKQRYNLNNLTLFLSDCWENIPQHPYQLVISNPPYVATDSNTIANNYEPPQALYGGNDGLTVIKKIIQVPSYLNDYHLLLEHDINQDISSLLATTKVNSKVVTVTRYPTLYQRVIITHVQL